MATIKVETFSNVNFNTASLERLLKAALDKSAKGVATDFNAVTATWKGSPKAQIRREGNDSRLIGVDDDRWRWNNNGTSPHKIRRRRAKALKFQASYKRKTATKRLSSTSGGPFGIGVRAIEVNHPGNKAALWNMAAAEKRTPELVKDVQAAIRRTV